MKTMIFSVLVLAIGFMFVAQPAYSHCEVPCGIYGDEMRFQTIEEHIATIEKAMKMIVELSDQEPVNYNQVVRWVTTKENHANEIQHIVTQYFLTQRVKPVDKEQAEEYAEYLEKLEVLHHMLVYAMKSKQTTDLAHVEKLRMLLSDFHMLYFDHEAGSHK